MYYDPYMHQYQYPNYAYQPPYHYGVQPMYGAHPVRTQHTNGNPHRSRTGERSIRLMDYGPNPFVVNINEAAKQNKTYRTALWTGKHLQVTLMSIGVGENIGLEIHPHVDQFLRIEQGEGIVRMGKSKDNLDFERKVFDDSAIMVPAGTWHDVINTGNVPLKLYSIYAPPNHPANTVDPTKADAKARIERQRQQH